MSDRGATLIELLVAVGLIGVLAALAAPTFTGIIARVETRGALDRFAGDAAYARMLAVRNGTRVDLQLLNSGVCPAPRPGRFAADGYRITVRRSPPRVAREVRFRNHGSGVCLVTSNDGVIVYGGRGLPLVFENRTIWARKGNVSDSLTISVLGRILRRY
ncbi:MAG TPA: prepilin-type N-terminal cleavage/methylation domain-containing protein [Longimicrobium sp.]|nr:prepilin-type N-terminal cleavage/methylation domain-containing protein [Longimicrobium sp.]